MIHILTGCLRVQSSYKTQPRDQMSLEKIRVYMVENIHSF